MLGPFGAMRVDGRPVPRPGRRSIALIACLAVDPDTVWTRERRVALLWGTRRKEQARESLRQEIVRLRQALGKSPFIFNDRDEGVRLRRDFQIDVVQLRSALAKAGRLVDAAALYRGDLLEGMGFDRDLDAFEEWLATHRRRLKGAAVQCFVQLLREAIAHGDDAQSMRLAERAVAIEPACEEAHQYLIRNHAARRDLHAAIEQFHVCCEALRTQYNMEPSLEICRLAEQIRATVNGGGSVDHDRDRASGEGRPRERLTPARSALRSLTPVEDRPSIAVLPFVDLSAGRRDEALVDGLTEETITALAQIPGLLVTARHSVMAYKGAAKDVRRLAEELGVKYILEA